MSRSSSWQGEPRAVVHKRILEAAETKPGSSMEEIAAEVSGASIDLVERVLDEYGDPGETDEEPAVIHQSSDGSSSEDSRADPSVSDPSVEPRIDELSEKQHETLRAVFKRPSATQEEIGDALGVSRATVSARLRDIEGFDWQDRGEYVAELFEHRVLGDGEGQAMEARDQEIEARLSAIEDRLEAMETSTDALLAPELAHKVFHACMDSEQLSEDEELEVLRALM